MDHSYNRIADYYDLWCESDPSSELCQSFYLRNCPLHEAPIVEVGAGTGRIALGLAKLGLKVIGVDNSRRMLEQFARKIESPSVRDNLELVCTDFLDFMTSSEVGQIIMPFRTIGHFKSYPERLQLFRHVRSLLKPGRFFIFDHFVFYNLSSLEDTLGQDREVLHRQTKEGTVRMKNSVSFDHPNQILNSKLIVETIDYRGLATTLDYSYQTAWVYPSEIESLANLVGFKIVNCFGAFDETTFNNRSSEQIWVMQAL